MLFTTSKPLQSWGQVLHDEDLAETLIDCILERGRLIHLDGLSRRTKHLETPEWSTQKEPTRTEFLEFTGQS